MRPLIINDRTKIEAVYEQSIQYLNTNDLLYNDIGDTLWAYNEIGTLIPQTTENFWSGHFFPFSESYYELENSLQFCFEGFYRHSLATLRTVLELAVIGLYFDMENKAHIDIQEWLHSIDPTPFLKKCLNRMFELEPFSKADKSIELHKGVLDLYNSLSDSVHVRGYRFSTTGYSKTNYNQFNDQALRTYVETMKRVVAKIVTMILLQYPLGMQTLPLWEKFGLNSPMGGMLDESSQKWIFKVLDDKTMGLLHEISNNDPFVQDTTKFIVGLPDLTDDQHKTLSDEFDKMIEEHRYRPPDQV